MISQQGHVYPVYVSDAHGPHGFAVTIIGDPDAAPGAVQVHVVYPVSAPTVSDQEYPLLLRCFATHLVAHAAQYEAAEACGRCQERRAMTPPTHPPSFRVTLVSPTFADARDQRCLHCGGHTQPR
jgi:hypothetical protein